MVNSSEFTISNSQISMQHFVNQLLGDYLILRLQGQHQPLTQLTP